jgi:[acyl-carrier-protein] S-malonyltransferase
MRKFALLFPGQGSQSLGMMRPFAESRVVREVFDKASQVLAQDLWRLAAEGPEEALSATVNTQPLMLTAGYAVYRAWREAGGADPLAMAGHSLGEYTALTAAGVISFSDAIALVRARARRQTSHDAARERSVSFLAPRECRRTARPPSRDGEVQCPARARHQ